MKKKRVHAGDVFAIDRYDGSFGFGRLLLDVEEQCVKALKLEPQSPLHDYGKAVLVEVYRERSSTREPPPLSVGVSGIFVRADLLRNGTWPVVGHAAVEPSKVEFPENLVAVGLKARFTRGEVALPVHLSESDLSRIAAYPTLRPADALVHISRFLTEKDQHGETVPPPLQSGDLRFSPERKRVYELLGEPADQPYSAFARKHGFDLKRFYD